MPIKKTFKKKASRKRVPRKTTKVSFAVKKYVKRTIAVAAENKFDWNQSEGVVSNALLGSVAPLLIKLLPLAVGQGVAQGNRIGNSITIKRNTISLCFWPLPYNVSTNPQQKPQMVRVMILKQKQMASGVELPVANEYNKIFQLGSNSTGFINNLQDMTRTVNTDIFTVKYNKILKIGVAARDSGTPFLSTVIPPNNDYKLNHMLRINIAKMIKQKLRYDDSTTNKVTNDNLFLVIQTVAYDNTLFTYVPIGYSLEQTTQFED